MTLWKSLLLIYSSIDVRYSYPGKRSKRFVHALSEPEIRDAVVSFAQFPTLLEELTSGRAGIEYQIHSIERPLTSVTQIGQGMFWPSPDDTREEIDRLAPAGSYDSIFVPWPQRDLAADLSIPSGGWGLAMSTSGLSNDATYAAVAKT